MTRRALLIGVDRYHETCGRDLGGCRNDVAALAAVLRTRLRCDDVRTLLDEDATRDGLTVACGELAAATGPGDSVLVFWAGHASHRAAAQAPDALPSPALVMSDSGRGAAPNRDLSERALAALLAPIEAAALDLTVVLDVGGGGEVRTGARATARQLAPAPGPPSLAQRRCQSGWELGDRTTIVSACRRGQVAHEDAAGGTVRGAFSAELTRLLKRLTGPAPTWSAIVEAITPRLAARFPSQHPVCEGPTERALMGLETLGGDDTPTAPVPRAAPDPLTVAAPTALAPYLAASVLLEAAPAGSADIQVTADPDGTWLATGRDGLRATHITTDARALIADLEGVARYRTVLRLGAPTLCGPAAPVRLELLRIHRARAVPAGPDPDGRILFEEGDRADFEITNRGAQPRYITLLELGVDGAITHLLPDPDRGPEGGLALAPGEHLRVARDHYGEPSGLPLSLPDGFPFAAGPAQLAPDTGALSLVLLAPTRPTSFASLTQGATRGATRAPDLGPDGAAVTRSVAVRRARPGVALAGAPVIDPATGITIDAPGLGGRVRVDLGGGDRTRSLEGERPPWADALEDAGMQTLATVTIDAPEVSHTRDARAVPRTAAGEEALTITLPPVGADRDVAALTVDESGFARWVLGVTDSGGSTTVLVPRPDVQPASSTRALLPRGGLKKAIKLMVWRRVEGAVETFERLQRAYCARTFTPEDFDHRKGRTLTTADWRRLAAGPALVMIHGTFCHTKLAYSELDAATVAELHDRYDGRVFAFDHPSLSVSPADNVRWLIDQLPDDVSVTLDAVGHSRGGLVARSLAAWGPPLSGGRVRVRRVVCAAAPNRGTPLARSEHAAALLTAMTEVASREQPARARELMEGLLALLKGFGGDLVTTLPGLLSMDPGGAFLTELAAAEANSDALAYGICARFEAPRDGGGLDRFSGLLTDAFFGEDHDLVVPSDGVHQARGPRFPIPPERRLDIGEPGVWHNALFGRADVRRQLLDWLGETE